MRILLGLAGAVLVVAGVRAEPSSGFRFRNTATNEALRVGTFCRLTRDDAPDYEGLCNVYRNGATTIVDAGRSKYRIVRDDFTFGRALFYIDGRRIGWVTASGSCWEGAGVRYCAK